MKKIMIIITALILVNCSKGVSTIDYPVLIGKHISDPQIVQLFKHLGNDYNNVNAYDMHYYGFDEVGVKLNFSDKDTLRTIYFSKDIKGLPYELKMHFTRDNVEKKLGKADFYRTGNSNYTAYYTDKKLIVRYRQKDSTSMTNQIHKVLVTNINKERIEVD